MTTRKPYKDPASRRVRKNVILSPETVTVLQRHGNAGRLIDALVAAWARVQEQKEGKK